MPNYFQISPVVFNKIFTVFSLWLPWLPDFCMACESLTTLKGDHPGIIPVRFGKISPNGLGGDVI